MDYVSFMNVCQSFKYLSDVITKEEAKHIYKVTIVTNKNGNKSCDRAVLQYIYDVSAVNRYPFFCYCFILIYKVRLRTCIDFL